MKCSNVSASCSTHVKSAVLRVLECVSQMSSVPYRDSVCMCTSSQLLKPNSCVNTYKKNIIDAIDERIKLPLRIVLNIYSLESICLLFSHHNQKRRMTSAAAQAARALAADETIPLIEVVFCVPPQTTVGAKIALFGDRKRFQKREHAMKYIDMHKHLPPTGTYLAMIKGTRREIETHSGFMPYGQLIDVECDYGGKMAHQCEWEIVQTQDKTDPPKNTEELKDDDAFMYGTKEAADKALDFISRHCLLTKPGYRLVIKQHKLEQTTSEKKKD